MDLPFPDQQPRTMHISVASATGAYTIGNPAFFRYIMLLANSGVELRSHERDALAMLVAIPHAFFEEEDEQWGHGWRVVPAATVDDWPVLESTPQRIRDALETARRTLWERAGTVGVSAQEIVAIEDELDQLFGVLEDAERAGVPVRVSYVG